ncbi:MAG: UDP-2,3-diacylglucosamine diphosphatase [Bacteroidales bacterium]|nr:UDP-2,3-diacylglucosamine diphosphatase [Bacteroidales bacterium]
MKKKKRRIDLVVISDVHLGTYGSQANELHRYLQKIKPDILILNGDIIDFWQFSKRYWPKSHMKVIKSIINLAAKGTRVCYIPGNHDEILRKFAGMRIGNIEIVNKLELNLNGMKTWFFHGDVFDVIMQHSKWLARLGAIGYDYLILLNVFVNYLSRILGRGKVSLSKIIKENVKTAVNYISNFENTAASLAIQKGYQAIVCGHIHHPEIKDIILSKGSRIMYLNSGDWIENLSALEYHEGLWSIYRFPSGEWHKHNPDDESEDQSFQMVEMESKEIFRMMVDEFQQ